jgi:tetratricopeptide (TPR) repeat protein
MRLGMNPPQSNESLMTGGLSGTTGADLSLRERVSELRALVRNQGATYDAEAVIAELHGLISSARGRSDARDDLRQLLILAGIAQYSRGDRAAARALLIDGLSMDAGPAADPDEVARDHYFLAGVASELKSFQTAAEHYAKAAEHAVSSRKLDDNQRLGIRERQAFALHEAGRFQEALEVNRALLAQGERLFGAEDHRLGTALVNTAQNLYALKRLAEAESYLERALHMAAARGETEREQDLLYQLAVVTGEQGRLDDARRYLADRVERLQPAGPSKLLEGARRTLEHFDLHRPPGV